MKGHNMYEVVLQSPDRFVTEDQGEALQRAVLSATEGRAATVSHYGGLVWEVEVGTKSNPSDPYHPAIVHYREDCPSYG
jgi:hypothetical protein